MKTSASPRPNSTRITRGYELLTAALRGPRVITLRGCAFLAVGSVLGTLSVDQNLGRPFGFAALLAFILTAVTGLVLLIGRYTVLRACTHNAANPWVALIVFALSGAVRPVLATWIGSAAGVDVPLDLNRVAQATVSAIVALTIVAIALDISARHHHAVADLQSEVEDLEQQREASQVTVNRVAAAIDGTVVRVLRASLVETLSELTKGAPVTADGLRQVAQSLADINERFVRPMSHSLYRNEDVDDLETAEPVTPPRRTTASPRRRNRLREIFLLSPFHPVAMAIIVGTSSVFLSVTGTGWAWGLFIVLIESLTFGLMLALSNRILNFERRQRMRDGTRAAAVLGMVTVAVFAALGIAWALTTPVGTFVPSVAAVGIVWMYTSWLALAVLASSSLERARVIGVLQATRTTRQWELDALNLELKALRTQRASFLHGKIQSRLTLCAVQLNRMASALSSAELPSAESVDAATETVSLVATEVEFLIADIDKLLGQAASAPDFAASLESIRNAWLGIIDITYSGESATSNIAVSRALATTLIEVLTEAVTNAAKHGDARKVKITLEERGSAVVFVVDDDGRGLPASPNLSEPAAVRRIIGPSARCTIANRPEGGTRLEVELPTATVAAAIH